MLKPYKRYQCCQAQLNANLTKLVEFSSWGIILAPILPPTRLDGIWGSLWCSLVLIELSFAGGLSLTNQAKHGKFQNVEIRVELN